MIKPIISAVNTGEPLRLQASRATSPQQNLPEHTCHNLRFTLDGIKNLTVLKST